MPISFTTSVQGLFTLDPARYVDSLRALDFSALELRLLMANTRPLYAHHGTHTGRLHATPCPARQGGGQPCPVCERQGGGRPVRVFRVHRRPSPTRRGAIEALVRSWRGLQPEDAWAPCPFLPPIRGQAPSSGRPGEDALRGST